MNLLASMSSPPQTSPQASAPAAPATPELSLLALSFFSEMQDCAAPVADESQVKDGETTAAAETPQMTSETDSKAYDLAFMPAFFMPAIPLRPLPVEVPAGPVLAPLAADPMEPGPLPAVPPATLPVAEMVAVSDHADQPDLPVQRSFELATVSLPGTKLQIAEGTPLKLEASQPSTWPRHLESALKERLDVQLGNGIDHAVIKLSPPMLGALEISIKHEAGALSVQLHASNSEVTRQLQSITEHLRNDLSLKEYTSVAVEVRNTSMDKEGSSKKQTASQEEIGQALAESDEENTEFGLMLARI